MQELLDIVDPLGNLLGRAKPRSAVHREGDWHRTVHIWIVNKRREVLFQKRSADRESFPGTWDVSSAGHVSSGESPVEAAKKELLEELGMRAADGDLLPLFCVATSSTQHGGLFLDNEISEVFLVRKNIGIADLTLQYSEVTSARFFPLNTLHLLTESTDPAFAPHPEEYRRLYEYLCG